MSKARLILLFGLLIHLFYVIIIGMNEVVECAAEWYESRLNLEVEDTKKFAALVLNHMYKKLVLITRWRLHFQWLSGNAGKSAACFAGVGTVMVFFRIRQSDMKGTLP